MKTYLRFDRLFAYSEKKNKFFNSTFDEVNIIHGRNTSGKSTLIQTLLYTIGINDGRAQLQNLLDDEPFFRLDCTLTKNNISEKLTFIREDGTLFIRHADNPIQRFNGINGDNSFEHIKLKDYLHGLFNFSLRLESTGEYKAAPIETMFLPYYVSQAVGWVYIRKSFGNLDFYKNFKEDYLDYYLGIENPGDRLEKQKLQRKQVEIQQGITFYSGLEKGNTDWQVTKIIDEKFSEVSIKYIEAYKVLQAEVLKKEREYVTACNTLSYYIERRAVLTKVGKHHKTQNPTGGHCPTCAQTLPSSIPATYKYLQEENDTERELAKVKELIQKAQTEANSLQGAIAKKKAEIARDYNVLKQYGSQKITFDTWLKNKTNTQLIDNVTTKLGELTKESEANKEKLKNYKTEADVLKDRHTKNVEFGETFASFLRKLEVKALEEDRYTTLYKIAAFPSQGVELHKTVAAYHFALNKLIYQTDNIHRFPFLLDAIFKEDFEGLNKDLFIKFIAENRPKDTQIFMSMAEEKIQNSLVGKFNTTYFSGKAKQICIGGGIHQRTFLSDYKNEEAEYLQETQGIING